MHYEFITTVNQTIWDQYGQRSVGTWQTQPRIYWQGDLIDSRWDHWRQRARTDETGRFERESVRFSHKVQAQIHHTRQSQADWVIWLDADVKQHTPYTDKELEAVLPGPDDMCTYLSRSPHKYAETGWIAYNRRHPRLKEFMRRFEDIYLTGEIFTLTQTHDAWVWDWILTRGRYPARSLLHKPRSAEPFDDSDLAQWFRHYKGQRKRNI
jgi:hypothetical protein